MKSPPTRVVWIEIIYNNSDFPLEREESPPTRVVWIEIAF